MQTEDLYPLRESVFEGQMVKIPYNYGKLLTQEYGKASLTKTKYSGYSYFTCCIIAFTGLTKHSHQFNSTSKEWERLRQESPAQEADPCLHSQSSMRGGGRPANCNKRADKIHE